MLLVVFVASFFVPYVSAREGVFVIGPMQETTETVELTVSENTSVDVCGNVSVINGFVDFYVTSPSGNIILCYNKTSFSCFNFSAIENGTYILHLANTESENDVTATLNYGVNFEIILQAVIHPTWRTVATWQTTIITPSPYLDILEILKILGIVISTIGSLATLGEKVLKLIGWLYWKIKHGKSKTPVVLRFIGLIMNPIYMAVDSFKRLVKLKATCFLKSVFCHSTLEKSEI